MQVEYEGKTYDLDLEDMDTDEAAVIERSGVPNLQELENGVARGDLTALRAVFWLMLHQAGETVRIDRVKYRPVKFLRALAKASEDEAKAKAEGDDPKED